MNIRSIILGAVLAASPFFSFAQSYPGYKDLPGTTVTGMYSVVSYQPGEGAFGDGGIPENALGEPDANSGGASVSLGKKGSIIGSFGSYALKGDGTSTSDLYVFEEGWWDSFDVYISTDNANWTKLTQTTSAINDPHQDNSGSWVGYDIDIIGTTSTTYPFVKIVDTSNSTSEVPGTDGADIDAVIITSAQYTGGGELVDTDSRNGIVYNLEKNNSTGTVDVKIIDKNDKVSYIPFSTDGSLDPVAVSVQGNFDCDDVKDINVLATNKDTGEQLNIIKDQTGKDIRTINNGIVK